jgi:integral membrane sensor domain MASE1
VRVVGAIAAVVVLLALFVPVHDQLWPRFPAWYHVVFLASLVVFTPLGALRRQR